MKIKTTKKHKSKDKYWIKQDYQYVRDDHWDWSIWVESSENGLDQIENVIYNLHYTFPNPVRMIKTRENKFKLETSGWGIFTIYIRINFNDNTTLDLEHDLKLQ